MALDVWFSCKIKDCTWKLVFQITHFSGKPMIDIIFSYFLFLPKFCLGAYVMVSQSISHAVISYSRFQHFVTLISSNCVLKGVIFQPLQCEHFVRGNRKLIIDF